MRKSLFPLSLIVSLALSACSTILSNLPGVYKVDIQQGNVVDQNIIDQLRPSMNKRQVLFIMGSPMMADPFHQDRWDYLYSNQPGGDDRVQKRVTIYFKDDHIAGLQGDLRPSALPVIKPSEETTVELPKRHLERTLSEKILGLFSGDETESSPNLGPKPANSSPNKIDP
ncbi:MAG: outer membrane protein assembly factor BamE [Methylococcaceae bacterium]|jgi:outer membrane protein assembly factor BamE